MPQERDPNKYDNPKLMLLHVGAVPLTKYSSSIFRPDATELGGRFFFQSTLMQPR